MKSSEEKEWQTTPTDLAGWAMRATEMLRQRDSLRETARVERAWAEDYKAQRDELKARMEKVRGVLDFWDGDEIPSIQRRALLAALGDKE